MKMNRFSLPFLGILFLLSFNSFAGCFDIFRFFRVEMGRYDQVRWTEHGIPPEVLFRNQIDESRNEYLFVKDHIHQWVNHDGYRILRDLIYSRELVRPRYLFRGGLLLFQPREGGSKLWNKTVQKIGMALEEDLRVIEYSELRTYPREVGRVRIIDKMGSEYLSSFVIGHSNFINVGDGRVQTLYNEAINAAGGLENVQRIEFIHFHPHVEYIARDDNGHVMSAQFNPLSPADINYAQAISRAFRNKLFVIKAVTLGQISYEARFKNGVSQIRVRGR